jgi:RNA polymerase-interacting CarD/CdnL/TRCF family regulator
MGEIKSTLDLVMEKTKNLSLSDEERQGQKNKEIESRIRGLLQKFNDQALNVDNLRSEYQKLQKDYDLSDNAPLIKEICRQIELGKDNHALFELLVQFKVADIEGVTSVLHEFDEVIDAAAQERSKILQNKLAEAHFVSGPAVVPNLEADKAWREKAREIRAKFEPLLNQAKTKLLAG